MRSKPLRKSVGANSNPTAQFLAVSGLRWTTPPRLSAVPTPRPEAMPPRNCSAAEQLGSNIAAADPGTAGTPVSGQLGSVFPLSPPATFKGIGPRPPTALISPNMGARKDVPAVPRRVSPSPTFQVTAIFGFLVKPKFE